MKRGNSCEYYDGFLSSNSTGSITKTDFNIVSGHSNIYRVTVNAKIKNSMLEIDSSSCIHDRKSSFRFLSLVFAEI